MTTALEGLENVKVALNGVGSSEPCGLHAYVVFPSKYRGAAVLPASQSRSYSPALLVRTKVTLPVLERCLVGPEKTVRVP
jgi:hypothetical protein